MKRIAFIIAAALTYYFPSLVEAEFPLKGKIAFGLSVGPPRFTDLYVINADGTDLRLLMPAREEQARKIFVSPRIV